MTSAHQFPDPGVGCAEPLPLSTRQHACFEQYEGRRKQIGDCLQPVVKESEKLSVSWDKGVLKLPLYPPQLFSDRVLQNKSSPEISSFFTCWPVFGSVVFGEVIDSYRGTEKKNFFSFSNSHSLLGLLSYHATNLKLCQSRTSTVRQTLPPW